MAYSNVKKRRTVRSVILTLSHFKNKGRRSKEQVRFEAKTVTEAEDKVAQIYTDNSFFDFFLIQLILSLYLLLLLLFLNKAALYKWKMFLKCNIKYKTSGGTGLSLRVTAQLRTRSCHLCKDVNTTCFCGNSVRTE